MKLVVADASPINYLLLIGEQEILRLLYRRITVPEAVYGELTDLRAPLRVAQWMKDRPEWIDVRMVDEPLDPNLFLLGLGERAAIALAGAANDVLLLIDDAQGRKEATRRGILTIGTLGVLNAARAKGLLDFDEAIRRLLGTNFRIAKSVLSELESRRHRAGS